MIEHISSGRTRIAFVINSLAGGGAERVMTTLLAASEARRDAHDLCLVLLDDEPEAYAVPDWLPVYRLASGGGLLKSARLLHRFLKRWRADATVSFLSRANFACVASAWLRGHRTIISERVNSSAHFGTGARASVSKTLVRALYPRADRVIAVSAGVCEDLVEHFAVARDRIAVIDNPVDGDAIRARAAEPTWMAVPRPYAIAIGRLTRTKNHRLLIDAFAQAGTPATLLLLGEGPERAALEAQVAALGLGDRVVMPGFVANPFALMTGADLYVSASNGEGFPNGLVEAMAAGLPVVSTNCASGPSEILAEQPREAIHGLVAAAHGVLVPTDDVTSLAAGLAMFADPWVRADYGRRAMARAADFGVAAAEARYWAVIHAAL